MAAKIAPGYGTVAVTFEDGKVIGDTLNRHSQQRDREGITVTDLSDGMIGDSI